jgi:hypothetical protein
MRVLVISPLHDYPTYLSNKAVLDLLDFLKKRNVSYDHLSLFANRFSVNLLAKKGYNGVFYYGHGQEDRLGDILIDFLPLIDANNVGLFQNSIIYTMSCLSGVELGKIAIKKGVKAYFGHSIRYFAFVNLLGSNHDFIADWIKLVNYIPKALVEGKIARKALIEYENFANDLYTRYLKLDKEKNLKILYLNALYLELYGNPAARL